MPLRSLRARSARRGGKFLDDFQRFPHLAMIEPAEVGGVVRKAWLLSQAPPRLFAVFLADRLFSRMNFNEPNENEIANDPPQTLDHRHTTRADVSGAGT